MAKNKKIINKNLKRNQEWDLVYLLKLALFLLIGSQWLYVVDTSSTKQLALPYGALIGIIFALQDHFKIDRKIEYAVILIAMFVGYGLSIGVTVLR